MTNTKKLSICMGRKKSNCWRNGVRKNIEPISREIVKNHTGLNLKELSLMFFLCPVLFLFLFVPQIYGQSFSENNIATPHSYELDTPNYDTSQYDNTRRNKTAAENEPNHEQTNIAKNYPHKRKIQLSHTNKNNNKNEHPNNFVNQQEEDHKNKQNAIKKIPWDELSTPVKQKISSLIQNHSVYHCLPSQAIFCDPEVYQYFLEHPDLLVGFWENLGVTQIALREKDTDLFNLVETTGTVADVGTLYRSTNYCVVYAKGEYKSPITTRKIDGEALLFLQSRYARNSENEPIIVCKLDVFIKLDNLGADLLAKLFATSLGKIVDCNFEQTLGFVSHVSDTSAISANSVKRLTRSVKSVRAEVRNEFVDVVDRVSVRAARRVEKRLYNYHRNTNDNVDEYHLGQNRIASPAIQNQHLDPKQNFDSIALNNEYPETKNESQNDQTQEIPHPESQPNNSPNKRVIFTPPKL
ncbi:MAG: hypothetical protein LBK06_07900 [Planctomycetaceae bacterium]|jgi:hypothetical protein|nr:hypothetical protein [Planctomycetaceae bacterium]